MSIDMRTGGRVEKTVSAQDVRVELGARSYTITIGGGLLADPLGAFPFDVRERSIFILTDENVAGGPAAVLRDALAGARRVMTLVLPAGEQTKSLARLEDVTNWLLQEKADRHSVLFAVGGGVIGDLGGFAASIVLRGIPYIQVPTTLLAQVDSSVGGKTGINTAFGKNLIGSFYQPSAVLCDLDALKTLPVRQMRAGYAEIVKYGLLGDAAFFDWLDAGAGLDVCAGDPAALAHAVATCCRIKAAIVAKDEMERDGARALLNLGHTFGHALEAVAGYDGRLLHGEAVAIGTVLAFRLSALRGHCDAKAALRVADHLKAIGLPTEIHDVLPEGATQTDAIIACMDHDKKTVNGKPVFILVNGIGRAFVARDVAMDDVRTVVEQSLLA